MIHIAGVLPRIVPEPYFRTQNKARYLRPQFFPRVTFAPKRMGHVAVQPVRMARPVPFIPISA